MGKAYPSREQRAITRHQLNAYLTIYNRFTDRPIGYIGNISAQGLMLISEIPIMVGEAFEMRIKIPHEVSPTEVYIDFKAVSQWSKPDVDQRYFDSGFEIVEADQGIINLASSLREFFSFR
ncbi:PilZ domain-containing protein [Zooshikella harenae]|uniref:PilZ domain-containing protein n=1 Tax=Zooshikella harenae TaxID=2827238 RepID=A0ABS5ZAC7_9GAMM|nr:PilZ domain-containing protein [Zooshikella harenae]MBU2711011.1 PilZ domain-containing protein [Zooshikella harenae]